MKQNEDIAYALRISEVLPTIKKLDTLASRYNTAHCGAGFIDGPTRDLIRCIVIRDWSEFVFILKSLKGEELCL